MTLNYKSQSLQSCWIYASLPPLKLTVKHSPYFLYKVHPGVYNQEGKVCTKVDTMQTLL